MAFLTFEGVGITALAAAVPKRVIKNYEYTEYFPADQVKLFEMTQMKGVIFANSAGDFQKKTPLQKIFPYRTWEIRDNIIK